MVRDSCVECGPGVLLECNQATKDRTEKDIRRIGEGHRLKMMME